MAVSTALKFSLCVIRVRVSSVNYKNKQLILEMLPIVVCHVACNMHVQRFHTNLPFVGTSFWGFHYISDAIKNSLQRGMEVMHWASCLLQVQYLDNHALQNLSKKLFTYRSIQPPKRPNRTNFFRRGSTFRYRYKFIWVISLCIDYIYICSGRTQLRLLQEGAANTLERKPSRRFERYMK